MVNEKMYELGSKKSTIREIFEYGRKRAQEVGEENIYDFSLGNPNVPAPSYIKEAVLDIFDTVPTQKIHSYTVAPGNPEVREILAKDINRRFGTHFTKDNLFMTAGAAASISITFKALAEPGDEFVIVAPFFPEYRPFVEATGARLVVVPAQVEDFQINMDLFERALTRHTKGVIVNSPNNPSGAIYSEETIRALSALLLRKEKEYSHPIYIISDEPYREIAYHGYEVPYIPLYYKDTIVCYSYSKSFSLPGERIGYIVIPSEVTGFEKVYPAICGAARVLTHVNAPSLWQLVVARCAGKPTDAEPYRINGELLYQGLIGVGFTCLRPQGAFYLFPKCLEEDDHAFCKRAMKYDLLLVPGTDFGVPGYFRASYCINRDTIKRSLPLFRKLAEEYGVKPGGV